jgi:hypothetical protein
VFLVHDSSARPAARDRRQGGDAHSKKIGLNTTNSKTMTTERMPPPLPRAAVVAALLSLAACGGGSTSSPPNLVLANIEVPTLTDETFENGDPTSRTLPPFQVTADLQGDIASLNGQTIFVLVEDPDGFVQGASLQQPLTSTQATLVVDTKTFGPRKGRYRNSFRIKVCFDASCAKQLAGSPITVPYDIEVLQGFVLNDNSPVAVTARVNEAVSVAFPLTLPTGLLYNDPSLPPPTGGQPQIEIGRMSDPAVIGWQIDAGPAPRGTITGSIPANVVSEFLWARAQVETPKGKRMSASAQVQVVYTISP